MNPPIAPSLFNRLALVRDLAIRGSTLLHGNPNPFDAIQGVVLLDLAIEIGLKTALAELGRQPSGDKFKNLLDAMPELQAHRSDVLALHDVRNAAQHRGAPPGAENCKWARRVAVDALRVLFAAVGTSFDCLSSVPQLRSPHFREPLALALERARPQPADAAALAACAMARVRGWVSHFTGSALVPNEMWVFANGLWNDVVVTAACADNRQEFLEAMLTIAAGAAMGIEPPALLRFARLAGGHRARATTGEAGFQCDHDAESITPSPEDVEWMVELVARCALRFESEWPDLVLLPDDEASGGVTR